MKSIGEVAQECAEAVIAKDWQAAIEASNREWILRTHLWPAIETIETKKIDQAAKTEGAIFTRVCGAGGGGVMAIFAPKDRVQGICLAMKNAGGKVLDVIVGGEGLRISK